MLKHSSQKIYLGNIKIKMDKFYLFTSSRKDKKYTMAFPKYGMSTSFGQRGFRDYTLINDQNSKYYIDDEKERRRIKQGYQNRHRTDNIDDFRSAGSLSWYILWAGRKLSDGIKAYEDRHNCIVIDKTDTLFKKNIV